MEDLKKRGRPSFKLSGDESSGEGGLTTGGTSTPPKKRGRPANPDKVKKSPSGRGRGRPAKYPVGSITSKVNADSEDGAATNDETVAVPAGRGRPPKKGKPKISHTIEATGKGRGRPSNASKLIQNDDDDDEDIDESMDEIEKPENSPQKVPGKRGRPPGSTKKAKKPGRPAKVVHSDDDADEASDDEEKPQPERKPLGRPPSGGTRLNIVPTGRGQGRPKKSVAAKRALDAANGVAPKRRGRPPSGKAPAPKKSPTGRPRGRPKTKVDAKVVESESQEEEESQDGDDNDDEIVELSPNGKGAPNNDDDDEDEIDLKLSDKKRDNPDDDEEDDDDDDDDDALEIKSPA